MKFEDIASVVDGVPYTTRDRGLDLYNHVIEQKPAQCLELGFAHGTSSCYTAAALHELGSGHLTAVDILQSAKWFGSPSIEDLLSRGGIEDYVTVQREATSYNWFLKRKIEEQTTDGVCEPIYDLCFVDGAHNWTVDGLAFFLVDKLLKDGGWIVFDDLPWVYDSCDRTSRKRLNDVGINVDRMDDDERNSPQVGLVYDLLVRQHPNYTDFRVEGGTWGFARKQVAG